MSKDKRFYNFVTQNEATELYLYGAIVSDKWCEDEVSFTDFRDAIETMDQDGVLNIFTNSPGGEVFVTDAIVSMLTRAKENKNISINCYIDGLAASCASWLPMIADKIYVYDQSIMMLHKPMTSMWGANADQMKKEIELLDKIEDSMVKMYLSKVKEGVTEDKLREMIAAETWLDATEIQEYFDVELIKTEKKLVACVDNKLFENYKNIPEKLKDQTIEEPVVDEKDIKITELENKIKDLSSDKELAEEKLNEANEKAISLNEKIQEIQPLANKYNEILEEEARVEKENKIQEQMSYYKNKFKNVGAIRRFEEDDVQALINSCVDDENAVKELNNIIVDLINVVVDAPERGVEFGQEFDNLIPIDNGAEGYGFK